MLTPIAVHEQEIRTRRAENTVTKNVVICTLLLICVWFGYRVVDLEKYHHASLLNMCAEFVPDLSSVLVTDHSSETLIAFIERDECLNNAETRTHWGWHLAYGLEIL